MEKYKELVPGRRIMKTTIAVLISVQLFYFLGHYDPVHAALACILTMRTTSAETKSTGINRIIGTLIGGVSSYACLLLLQSFNVGSTSNFAPLAVAIFVMLSLSLCKVLKLAPYAMTISAVVTAVTLLSHNESHLDALSYVTIRIIETFVGFLIAYFVNKRLLPRRKKTESESAK